MTEIQGKGNDIAQNSFVNKFPDKFAKIEHLKSKLTKHYLKADYLGCICVTDLSQYFDLFL